jgi:GNAT superfamily N-acetyltransferase
MRRSTQCHRDEESPVEFGIDRSATAEVGIVAASHAVDGGLVGQIVALVNRVYADAEKGLWRNGTERTNGRDIAAIMLAEQLAVARLDGRLVGAVVVQQLAPGLGEFGMLVASPEHRGVGIGKALVAFAESWARQQGLSQMQLELLVPQTWTHPVKEFLRDWYARIGYRQIRTDRLADAYPGWQPQLATPCDFVIYRKIL